MGEGRQAREGSPFQSFLTFSSVSFLPFPTSFPFPFRSLFAAVPFPSPLQRKPPKSHKKARRTPPKPPQHFGGMPRLQRHFCDILNWWPLEGILFRGREGAMGHGQHRPLRTSARGFSIARHPTGRKYNFQMGSST